MARVLLLTTPEKGHVNPMVGVAQWLMREGHHTGWLCVPEPSPQVERLGVDVVRLEQPLANPGIVTRGEEVARLVRDRGALFGWIRALLLGAAPAQIAPIRQAFQRWRPDSIGLDPMLYGAILAAHAEGIPYLGISSSLNPITPESFDCDHTRNMRALDAERRALFEAHGLRPTFRVADCLSPHGNTVFATEAYAGTLGDVPAGTMLVGPSVPPGMRGDEEAIPEAVSALPDPFVYASFGSQISYQPEAFGVLARACADLGVPLLISAGDLAGSDFARTLPGRTVTLPYVPQLDVLKRAAVMVTHGGANSVMEALHEGVPLLVSPVCNDQPIQAAFVEAAGVGRVLDLFRASSDNCRAVLSALLAPASSFRSRAHVVQSSYRTHDGARVAARVLAGLAS